VAPQAKGHNSTKLRTMLIATPDLPRSQASQVCSLPSVKPWLKRRRIKAKRNEIALWILKIDGNLKMLVVACRNIAA
jgi:hypothetical protein